MPLGRRLTAATCALVVGAATLALAVTGTAGGAPRRDAPRPNVLLLVSDDQAWSDFSRQLMPTVFGDLVDQGALFKRAYVNTSLCCPSRAQMLTGLFEHHTGVDENTVPLDRPTIVQALHDQGYRTMLAGKYLNSWETCGPRPEFDRWACVGTPEPSTYSLVDPLINEDGTWQQFDGYQTDVLAGQVADFIEATPDDQPFFAMYTPTSPHLPADDFRYDSMPVSLPRPPSFDQDTMHRTIPMYARRPPLTPENIASSDLRFTRMSHAVRALDDGVRTILDSLGDRSRDTIVIYVSDNGFLFGEHRRFGKRDAYEESVRVPMVIRYPMLESADHGSVSQALVSNVDLAPTIAQLAGFPWHADGWSLVRLLDGSARSVRSALLIERCQGESRGIPPCSGLSFYAHQTTAAGFVGVVTADHKFVRYVNGDTELFDLRADPNELRNLVDTPGDGAVARSLRAELSKLLGPVPSTTIVTGPWPRGSGPSRLAAFTYFSPSRFSTYRCRLTRDGVTEAWHSCDGGSDAIGGLADGTYTFEVAGTDEFGHADPTPAARTFTIGSSGPPVSIDAHPAAEQTKSDAAFRFSSTASGVSFQCRMTPVGQTVEWTPCVSSGAGYTDLADGSWSFEVRAQDPTTNAWTQPPAEWLVRIDRTGPTFDVANAPPATTSSRDVTVRFSPTEPLGGPISCRVGGHAATDCSSGVFTADGLRNGSHTLSIVSRDALGNVGRSEVSWAVDVGPPHVRIARHPDPFTSETTVHFRLWSRADPVMYLCAFDEGLQAPCDVISDTGPLLDGPHRITVWGLDAALNMSAPITYRFNVDTIPPGLLLSGTPADGAVTADRTATFDIWQSEPGTLFCSLDAADFLPCTSPVVYGDLADGGHTFEVYVQDRAGNLSIVASRAWTIDPNAPVP